MAMNTRSSGRVAVVVPKSEPPESLFQPEEVQVQEPMDDLSLLISDGDGCEENTNASTTTKKLESTVKSLASRVRDLEQQITACLESQPLLYQVFKKCNKLEQSLKDMRKEVDRRLPLGEVPRGSPARPKTITSNTRSRTKTIPQDEADKDADTDSDNQNQTAEDSNFEDNDNGQGGQGHASDNEWEPDYESDPLANDDQDARTDSEGEDKDGDDGQNKGDGDSGKDNDSLADEYRVRRRTLSKKKRPSSSQSDSQLRCSICSELVPRKTRYDHELCHRLGIEIAPPQPPGYREKADWRCKECNHVADRRRTLLKHYRGQHPELVRPFLCKVCPPAAKARFLNEADLATHYTSYHTQSQLILGQGSPEKSDTNQVNVKLPKNCRSLQSISDRTCPDCGRIFQRAWNMTQHRMIKHSENPPPPPSCDICGKTSESFYRRPRLKEHQLKHHGRVSDAVLALLKERAPNRQRPLIPCPDDCGREFKTPHEVRHHLISCRKLKPHQCEECGAKFGYLNALREHLKARHGHDGGMERLPCPTCGKMVKTRRMRGHMQTHINAEVGDQFFCNEAGCGKGFNNAEGLKRHGWTHNTDFPFPCPHCDKSFKTSRNRNTHVLLHTGKPHVCDECGWGFIRPNLLQKHKLNHAKGTAKFVPPGARAKRRFKRGKGPPQQQLLPCSKEAVQDPFGQSNSVEEVAVEVELTVGD